MAQMKTPGVYILEKNAFPNSVVQVATAVPAFIGYTESATLGGNNSIHMKPFRLSTMAEFEAHFGGAPNHQFTVAEGVPDAADVMLPAATFKVKGVNGQLADWRLEQSGKDYCLYAAMRLFFQNGGGACYIVSIGQYGGLPTTDQEISAASMIRGIKTLIKEPEPTMVVIPETTRLVEKESISVQQAMLKHCGYKMRNRFALLDIHKGHLDLQDASGVEPVKAFRNALGINQLDFGAAYYPWVESTAFASREFTFENIVNRDKFATLLKKSIQLDNSALAKEQRQEVGLMSSPQLPPPGGDEVTPASRSKEFPLGISISNTDGEEGGKFEFLEPDEDNGDVSVEIGENKKTAKAKKADKEVGTWIVADKTITFTPLPHFSGEIAIDYQMNVKNASGTIELDKSIARVVVEQPTATAPPPKPISLDISVSDEDAVSAGSSFEFLAPDEDDGDASVAISEDKKTAIAKKAGKEAGTWTVAKKTITFTPLPHFSGEIAIDYQMKVPANATEPQQFTAEVVIDGPTVENLDKTLRAICPLYADVMNTIAVRESIVAPGALMAGIYTMVDNTRGVWKAPANVSLNSVVKPMVKVSHDDQEDLNVSAQGKSINAIRPFVGEGTLVWGARTLDGNSLDWRYINVRRTMIMIEESIRLASKAYVFEPNVANTWVTIQSMIDNFLNSVWKQGGLAGAVPSDAYSVHVGLGDTICLLYTSPSPRD